MRNAFVLIMVASSGLVTLSAQQQLVLPAHAAAIDAGSAMQIGGFDQDGRTQVLIDDALLSQIIGRQILSLAFRRDGRREEPMASGASSLSVVISRAGRSPEAASPRFVENLDPQSANRVTVFQGIVQLPDSPDASGRRVDWNSVLDVVRIPFDTPYRYIGGDLCIDIAGVRVPGTESRIWGVDAEKSSGGTATELGTPCGGVAFPNAGVAGYALVPGSTAEFSAYEKPSTPGAFIVGLPMAPVDLAVLGAAGCTLDVTPLATIPVSFGPLPSSASVGFARATLQIPAAPTSLDFGFRAQFVVLGSPLTTTNSVDCIVAGSMPSLGMSSVHAGGSVSPSLGVVRTNRAPVMRFELR